ncbi:MAG: TerB family tellurite resistance protein [Myxococcota bacterium]
MQALDREDRLRLMRFICSFAWADLEVQSEERQFVGKLIKQLDLDDEEVAQVEAWLQVPPTADELDPAEIPAEHRQLFLDTARAMIVADGKIDADEAVNFDLLEQLLVD